MNPMVLTILITSLATSTIITMSSHHWLMAWLGLELSTLSILPIIMQPKHPRATEATTKYFLMQATAAGLILFAGSMNAWHTGHWLFTQQMTPTTTAALTTAIALKLGLAPTHAWYPDILQGSTMTTAAIISTWQKLAPLTFLYLTLNHLPTTLILTIASLSTLLGGWMGLNQTQTRKLMAFSSISHMGWLITALTLSPDLATLTMTTYIIMTVATFLTLNTTTSKSLLDLGTSWAHSPTLQAAVLMILVSLGGLPPLTGFMPKWLILTELVSIKLIPLATTLIMASLPSLFFYTRLTYLTVLTTPPTTTNTEHKWRLKTHTTTSMALLMSITTLLLPITPMLYNI
uniref:NADH-ubiquinone oxidoreductase chain 2 n=1 Tax=Asaccus montanus TaxID=886395 RepID=E2FZ45_9SAUR|nr:NADH dehydrogenase subunit 2 [Asaccus montanus]